jgi:hypothetical protein
MKSVHDLLEYTEPALYICCIFFLIYILIELFSEKPNRLSTQEEDEKEWKGISHNIKIRLYVFIVMIASLSSVWATYSNPNILHRFTLISFTVFFAIVWVHERNKKVRLYSGKKRIKRIKDKYNPDNDRDIVDRSIEELSSITGLTIIVVFGGFIVLCIVLNNAIFGN